MYNVLMLRNGRWLLRYKWLRGRHLQSFAPVLRMTRRRRLRLRRPPYGYGDDCGGDSCDYDVCAHDYDYGCDYGTDGDYGGGSCVTHASCDSCSCS